MGTPDGFAEFVTSTSSRLVRAGWLMTGDWAAAEDLVQTALAATWSRWQRVAIQHPEAYVRRVMVTTFLGWNRRRWVGEIASEHLPERGADDVALAMLPTRHAVTAALSVLPARQRAVVVLRYFLDLSEAQTAAAMGCTPGTVKSQTAKALARLRAVPGLAEAMTEGVTR